MRGVGIALIAWLIGPMHAAAGEVERFVVNGTQLAYIEAGRGAPVVLVHGGLQDYRLWQAHLAAFDERYRVIAYSRRNHFPNAVSAEGASDAMGDVHGDDLAGLIEGLGLGRVHVVAHSGGALAALFFAPSILSCSARCRSTSHPRLLCY